MGKSKKSEIDVADVNNSQVGDDSKIEEAPALSYEEQLENVSIIASPIATKKLAKRLYKLIKKASEYKGYLRHGLKDVQACIRKGESGLVVFAGDVTPIEVMCHMPGVCEDKGIDYIYTPSREDLGLAMGVKRSCLMILVKEHPDYKDLYDDCRKKMKSITSETFLK
ncbi:H/ACA ribonucleoprotein complex subunit 2-like protein [Araneus ventricosus]|uniref:H/ACA ribonucleoprotein complex subunit 2-like protein n=1 Tax=Araneus ventricosus TaxID=182803 RepID=A0A4Y2CRC3_ARAVE|nr:H/ACA ribonucleoprotein complex subunit 2-like protein [Araneus ventricosus]